MGNGTHCHHGIHYGDDCEKCQPIYTEEEHQAAITEAIEEDRRKRGEGGEKKPTPEAGGEVGPLGKTLGEPSALSVGDWVRILPLEEGFHIPNPYTIGGGLNITEEMTGMVGALYRVDALDGDLATVNGWAFRLDWLQRYVPEPTASPRAPEASSPEGPTPTRNLNDTGGEPEAGGAQDGDLEGAERWARLHAKHRPDSRKTQRVLDWLIAEVRRLRSLPLSEAPASSPLDLEAAIERLANLLPEPPEPGLEGLEKSIATLVRRYEEESRAADNYREMLQAKAEKEIEESAARLRGGAHLSAKELAAKHRIKTRSDSREVDYLTGKRIDEEPAQPAPGGAGADEHAHPAALEYIRQAVAAIDGDSGARRRAGEILVPMPVLRALAAQPAPGGQGAETPLDVEGAARKLLARIDEIHQDPKYQAVWTLAYLHQGQYRGPQYFEELEALRLALRTPTHKAPPTERSEVPEAGLPAGGSKSNPSPGVSEGPVDVEALIPELVEMARREPHEVEGCPEDDTCRCENIRKLNAEFKAIQSLMAGAPEGKEGGERG